MKTILYIDDNPAKINELRKNLTSFNVVSYHNPLKASYEIDQLNFDVILLDIFMPFMDGFALYDKIIKMDNYSGQPIFFTSETREEEHMIKALQKGAGELLTPDMPWSVKEQRILNRLRNESTTSSSSGDFHFDFITGKVSKDGLEVELTNIEMILFDTINRQPGINREETFHKVWGFDRPLVTNILSTHLTNLNKKIKCLGVRAISRKGDLTIVPIA